MISQLTLTNFKAHSSAVLTLQRLTVLVGPNGSGKSTVLQALDILSRMLAETPASIFQNELAPGSVLRMGADVPSVRIEASGNQPGPWRVATSLTRSGAGWQQATGEAVPPGGSLAQLSVPIRNHGSFSGWNEIEATPILHLDPRCVAKPSYTNSIAPFIEADGTNTASVLASLKLGNDERFDMVERQLGKLVPSVKRVRIQRAPVLARDHTGGSETSPGNLIYHLYSIIGDHISFDTEGGHSIAAKNASDGTLVLLALLTAIHAVATRPKILLIDDIEHTLHPIAQIELMKLILGLLESEPELQIIAATHSPYILDPLTPEQVLVFAPREDGTVRARPLSEHPDAARVSGAMSAGELWTSDQEAKWVWESNA